MPSNAENPHDGGFVLSLANRHRSLENYTIESGQVLVAGTVVALNVDSRVNALDPTGTDGSEVAIGILYNTIDTSSTGLNKHSTAAVVVRDAEVNAEEITWPDGVGSSNENSGAKTVLQNAGIRFRSA